MQWTRAVQWRLYDVMLWGFNNAEDAVATGKSTLARTIYQHTTDTWGFACDFKNWLGRSYDSDLRDRCWFAVTACQSNTVLLGLEDQSLRGANGGWMWVLKEASWIDALVDPTIDPQAILLPRSRRHHFRGIAYILQVDSRGIALSLTRK